MTMSTTKLFVSYSVRDKEFVQKLVADLVAAGLHVWINMWEITVGDSIVDKINHGISASDYLVAVISKNSVRSKWVSEELNAATVRKIEQDRRAFILPVLIERVELPPLLAHLKYADFRDHYDVGFQSLLAALQPAHRTVSVPEVAICHDDHRL